MWHTPFTSSKDSVLPTHIFSHLLGHCALNAHIGAGAKHAGLVLGEQMQCDRVYSKSVRACLACWQRQGMGRKYYGGQWWRVQDALSCISHAQTVHTLAQG